ncbi:MAG: sensor histidine kinase, partial [Poseidonibacter sp.]
AKPFICVKIYDKEKDLILEVNDNAGGVPEEIMDRIFEPYFTTKGPASGTGLGLYITKTIVDKHLQGTINVSNNEKGASFEIVIPNLDKRNETD